MKRYVTISVPRDVKRLLESLKKPDEDWGTFLARLAKEYVEMRRKEAFLKLTEILTEEDLRRIEQTSKEFRENFKLGERRC